MTPLSASGAIASTSRSVRSPSPSRYQTQHDVDDLVGVLGDDLFAGLVLDQPAELLVDVVVISDLHDDHARLQAHPLGNTRPAAGGGARAHGDILLTLGAAHLALPVTTAILGTTG